MNDIISDTLARLKNSVERGRDTVDLRYSKMVVALLETLKQEEFIEDFNEEGSTITVKLRYRNDEPIVKRFERVSSPGQRIYVAANEILPVKNGRGISVISTSEGLMTGAMAKSRNLGGEYLCNIW
jgi:small subunit ribosomal protein S8